MIKTFAQLQYPKDMESAGDTYFPEAIHFEFITKTGVDFNDVLQKTKSEFIGEPDAAETEKRGIRENAAKQSALDKGATVVEANELLEHFRTEQNYGKAVTTFVGEIQRQNAKTESMGNIYLNMPNNISLSEEAGWAGESLGVVGALSKKAFKTEGGGGVLSKLAGAGVGSAGNLISAAAGGIVGKVLSSIPGVGPGLGAIVGAIGGGVIQQGAQAAFSITSNPYMEMMFSGIGFRQFKFDFIFRARNKSEIDTVAKIIKMFRQHSRPTWVGGSLGKSFMKYPGEYKIKFLTLIGEKSPDGFRPGSSGMYLPNKYLPTLKECVCSAVETNFTPESIWSAYEHGAPVSITLGLTFNETELVMSDDIGEEYPDKQAKGKIMKGDGDEEFGNLNDSN